MTVRIVIPYAGPKHPRVIEAAPDGAEWFDVGGDGLAYWRLMQFIWRDCANDGRDLWVIEHDIIGRPDVGLSLDECPEPWCAFPYSTLCHPECLDAWANQLGCTRFRNSLIRAVPDVVSAIGRPEHRDWHNLCDGIGGGHPNMPTYDPDRPWGLRAAGYRQHWHWPTVDHLDRNIDPEFWYGPGGRYSKENA